MERERNYCIDLAKYIGAIFVVGIHTSPFQHFSIVANFYFKDVIFRLAVPFFFVCSGYFLSQKMVFNEQFKPKMYKWEDDNKRYIKKYAIHIILLYIVWSIIYLMILIPDWITSGWFSAFAFVDWAIALVRNGSYYHLWYLLCLIYAIPIFYVILSKISVRQFPAIILILYSFEVLEYGYRNFMPESTIFIFSLFDKLGCLGTAFSRALPFMLLGAFIEKNKVGNIKNNFICLSFSMLFLAIEASILGKNGNEGVSYIFLTLPAVFFLFRFVLGIDGKFHNPKFKRFGEISTIVYCIHPLLIKLTQQFGITDNMILFFVVSMGSSIIGFGYTLFRDKFGCVQKRLQNKK